MATRTRSRTVSTSSHGWHVARMREAALALGALGAGLAAWALEDGTAVWVLAGTVVSAVVAIAWLLMRLELSRRELAVLQRLDPLTGVGNDRALRERLAYEVTRHERHGRHLCLLLLDLDEFERVNERLGHPLGDQVLRAVGEALTRCVRDEDTVARPGGDEFAVIAPDVDATGASLLARRLERALARVGAGDTLPLRASIGWAIYPDDGISPDELLGSASAAHMDARRARGGLAGGGAHLGQVVQLRPPAEGER